MTTLAEQPPTQDEYRLLIEQHKIFATYRKPGGQYLIRNEHQRREHEIIANALQFKLDEDGWIAP